MPVLTEEHNWYTTLCILRSVELDAGTPAQPLIPMSPESGLQAAAAIASEEKPNLDYLAIKVSHCIQPDCLAKRFWGGVVFQLLDGSWFCFPEFQFGGAGIQVSIQQNMVHLDLTALTRLKPPIPSRAAGLAAAHHWYLQAFGEADPWKPFLWGFLSLEILVGKLCDSLRPSVVSSIAIEDSMGQRIPEAKPALPELIAETAQLPLQKRFLVVCLALSRRTSQADLDIFARCKKVRNDLAHGVITDETTLPMMRLLDWQVDTSS